MGLSLSSEVKNTLVSVTNAVWSSNIKYVAIRLLESINVKDLLDLHLRSVINKPEISWRNGKSYAFMAWPQSCFEYDDIS